MAYKDSRPLCEKVAEHLFWNTDELDYESAGIELQENIVGALEDLGQNLIWSNIPNLLTNIAQDKKVDKLEGLIRLIIFCSEETPNRFKGLFPAYLIKNKLAQITERGLQWNGVKTLRGTSITIKNLANILRNKTESKVAIGHFLNWAEEKNAKKALIEFTQFSTPPTEIIRCLSARLAQGANTNRSGHKATDIIKERMSEWGFIPELERINTSDVAVSKLCSDYTGPRKYDLVLKKENGEVALVCQSQMYTSDVGSIQGKNVEEDTTPNSHLKKEYPFVIILTHTEGFGCHTAMSSRLNHVLSSEIDGFIQLKNLDTKLRQLIRLAGCCSLLDLELSVFGSFMTPVPELTVINKTVANYNLSINEVSTSLATYKNNDLIAIRDRESIIRSEIVAYYWVVDHIMAHCQPLAEVTQPRYRCSSAKQELAIEELQFNELIKKIEPTFNKKEIDLSKIINKILHRASFVYEV